MGKLENFEVRAAGARRGGSGSSHAILPLTLSVFSSEGKPDD
jgi:hypothetical protein